MCENEKTLVEVGWDAFNLCLLKNGEPALLPWSRVGKTYRLANQAFADAISAEAVRRYLRDLPPGDEGQYEAFKEAWFVTDCGPFIERAKRSIAAVLAVHEQRAMEAASKWNITPSMFGKLRNDGWSSPEEAVHNDGWSSPEEAVHASQYVPAVQSVLRFASAEAQARGHEFITLDDMVVGLRKEAENLNLCWYDVERDLAKAKRKIEFDRDFWRTKQKSFDEQTRNLNARIRELVEREESWQAEIARVTDQRDRVWRSFAERRNASSYVGQKSYDDWMPEFLDGTDMPEWNCVTREG